MFELYNKDALVAMDELIDRNIKVDMVLTDQPYGILTKKRYSWDNTIPFKEMWEKINKLTNKDTPVLLFGKQPFTTYLNMSNINNFRYDIIWEKQQGTDFTQANKKPLSSHEIVSVFYEKQPTYNVQKDQGSSYNRYGGRDVSTNTGKLERNNTNYDGRYPKTVRKYSTPIRKNRFHPTQKPVDLLEWLIKSYTNENDIVLDFTMGSGSTGVACKNTNRRFIGIELDEKYFNIAKYRIMGEQKEETT